MKKQTGFTLIEFLIVFFVIGIIISIIVWARAGPDHIDDNKRVHPSTNHSERRWLNTKQNVPYFEECIKGQLFYVTSSTHSKLQMAGPVGNCRS